MTVGDNNVNLHEQSVVNSVEDIRILKKKVDYIERDLNDIKTRQQLTDHILGQSMASLDTLNGDFRAMDNKMEANIKEIQNEIKKSNEKLYEHQIEQLKQYKSTMWTVGGGVILSITGAVITLLFAL